MENSTNTLSFTQKRIATILNDQPKYNKTFVEKILKIDEETDRLEREFEKIDNMTAEVKRLQDENRDLKKKNLQKTAQNSQLDRGLKATNQTATTELEQ